MSSENPETEAHTGVRPFYENQRPQYAVETSILEKLLGQIAIATSDFP